MPVDHARRRSLDFSAVRYGQKRFTPHRSQPEKNINGVTTTTRSGDSWPGFCHDNNANNKRNNKSKRRCTSRKRGHRGTVASISMAASSFSFVVGIVVVTESWPIVTRFVVVVMPLMFFSCRFLCGVTHTSIAKNSHAELKCL